MRERACRRAGRSLMLLILAVALCWAQTASRSAPAPILDYIRHSWSELTRSPRDIAKAAPDPKIPRPAGSRWKVYVARDEDIASIGRSLRSSVPPAEFATIELRPLPEGADTSREHGLLYLPKSYVVPGGRFNEMYGWDSYFIQMGLLRDGEFALAKDMADNFARELKAAEDEKKKKTQPGATGSMGPMP